MKNIKLTLQYDGTKYNGFQKQNQKGSTAVTIQGKIESVLSKMTEEEISIIGCGRTDSGVHAENYVANFFTNSEMNLEDMEIYLNKYLPEDIVIKELRYASDRFHARYNVKSKTYLYRINNARYNNVFNKRFATYVAEELDIEAMKRASKYLIGTHDFRSFTSLKIKEKKSTIRTINYIDIKKQNDLITLEINGNGFLLNMVRIITGTLIEVGRHKISPDDIKIILEAKDKERAGFRAEAKGLTLLNLEY
ncbi:tRNA pseudouridine38-40 synthase [Clostridium cavendishii DSM 21758]|uniref:tRNA pseudouridine synthase A n=1 Tax=Clostridium cavendishii DSM 21758 TaxID=1121302 RepID=A0A1M6EB87_9CLOT|nr:tRNA pseudouridine(38-40) synthase TruA [Clostridium cavendishii]SHI82558.1 tRNA pseudouridine38-40 synthase [Clostridium cavendishii DSM 21758]